MNNGAELRDFIYLDVARVESLIAQLEGGLLQGRDEGTSTDASAQGSAEGQVPLLLKGGFQAQYATGRSGAEKRVPHHFIYSLLEKRLTDSRRLREIEQGMVPGEWDEASFRDGAFVRARGLIRLSDFDWMGKMLTQFPKMMRAVHHSVMLAAKEQRNAGQITQQQLDELRREQQQEIKGVEDLKLDLMVGLLEDLYGQLVHVKVVPDLAHPECMFVASANKDLFFDGPMALAAKYGSEVNADWVVVGQVNRSRALAQPLKLPTGNVVTDTIEGMVFALSDLIKMAQAVTFPAISMTPLCIYREC